MNDRTPDTNFDELPDDQLQAAMSDASMALDTALSEKRQSSSRLAAAAARWEKVRSAVQRRCEHHWVKANHDSARLHCAKCKKWDLRADVDRGRR